MKKLIPFALPALLLLASAFPAMADGARMPVYEGGTTLTASGHYYLTRDISVSSGTALSIDGEKITVDLNGYELETLSTSAPVLMIFDGSQDIAVENGRLTGGNFGVYHSSAIVRLVIRLENLEIRNSFISGIYFDGVGRVEILNCKVTNSNLYGIRIDGLVDGFQGRLVGNRVDTTGNGGMLLEGMYAGRIQKNEVTLSGSHGIEITTNVAWTNPGSSLLIEDNIIQDAGAQGMRIETPGCILRRNLVSGSSNSGFYFYQVTGSHISENVSRDNGDAGFFMNTTVNTLVENNHAEGNGSVGLWFVSSSTCSYRGNSLRGNTSGAVAGTANDDGGNLI